MMSVDIYYHAVRCGLTWWERKRIGKTMTTWAATDDIYRALYPC